MATIQSPEETNSWTCSRSEVAFSSFHNRAQCRSLLTQLHRNEPHLTLLAQSIRRCPNENLTDLLTSSATVSKIYEHLQAEIDHLSQGEKRDALFHIWMDMHAYYAQLLSLWLTNATIGHARNFFISKEGDDYILDEGNLPPFINQRAARVILQVGKWRSLAQGLCPGPPQPIQVILPPPNCTTAVEAYAQEWHEHCCVHLSKVFPFDEIHRKLCSVRMQLLQGDRELWRNWFEQLPREWGEKDFNRVYASICDTPVFEIRDGWEPHIEFSAAERHFFSRADVFNSLFELTFKARLASMSLQSVYMRIRSFDNKRTLTKLHHLRFRMTICVRAIERYIHRILCPFDELSEVLLKGPSFQDAIGMYSKIIDDISKEGIVRHFQIRNRVLQIFSACTQFTSIVANMKCADNVPDVDGVATAFDRNMNLLQRLEHQSTSSLSHLSLPAMQQPHGSLMINIRKGNGENIKKG